MEGVTCDLARCPELPVISHASIHYTAPGRMEPVADDDDNVVGYPVNTQVFQVVYSYINKFHS